MSDIKTSAEIAEMCREYIKQSGIKPVNLAAGAGVSYSTVFNFLNGKTDSPVICDFIISIGGIK